MSLSATIRNAGGELERRNGAIDRSSYGYLFRDLHRLSPWNPHGSNPSDAILALSEQHFAGPESGDNSRIPAGYAFLGQFITHDLSFAVPPFQRQRLNQRTPGFDLDCVYGGGPEVHPHLYEFENPDRFLIGTSASGERDLPRNLDRSVDTRFTSPMETHRRALIADPRNDENTIISQLHLAFLHLHNALVALHDFETARKFVRWSYQHVALHFLRRLCGDAIVDDVRGGNGRPNLRLFRVAEPGSRVFMPVEFAFAALRIGHSMIGATYHLNDALQDDRGQGFQLFVDSGDDWSERDRWARTTLEGERELPPRWTIQWDRFVPADSGADRTNTAASVGGNQRGVQASRLIDPRLTSALRRLPLKLSPGARDDRERSLAYRTLLSGWRLQLPSGQKIAELLGVKGIVSGDDPLWTYLLKEAAGNHGATTGPVAGQILTEVFLGLLWCDAGSFFHAEPADLSRFRDVCTEVLKVDQPEHLTLTHLLRAAGVPITRSDWDEWVS